MQTDNLNKYILVSLVIHAFFLMSLSITNNQKDISQIGEQGMQIQMVLIRDQQDDVQDEESINSSEKKMIKSEEKEEQAIVDNRLQGDRTNKIYQSYYGVVRSMLDSNKKYPLLSLQRRQEGTPIVEFTILQNGDVINIDITSSGFRLLDREAQKIVLKSAPFPPIPKSLGKNRIDLRVPINFSLQR
jgi:protein TonB|tara:strand:- start:228 stop:788 length:561 start_codon:yes stop_codon:yes gene_type:complete